MRFDSLVNLALSDTGSVVFTPSDEPNDPFRLPTRIVLNNPAFQIFLAALESDEETNKELKRTQSESKE